MRRGRAGSLSSLTTESSLRDARLSDVESGRLSADLHASLDAALPASIAVGAGTALFVCGHCFCPAARVDSLSILVNGDAQPVMAHGMPRLDLFRSQHPNVDPFDTEGVDHDPASPDDPLLHSYRSGFWGMAEIAPHGPGEPCRLGLRATLDGGGEVETELARIPTHALAGPVAGGATGAGDGPMVAICMATYEPQLDLLRRQLDTIRRQTHSNWTCLISDDCSTPRGFSALQSAVGDDPRFVVSRSSRRLGFYNNFERALAMAPTGARYVAMADQDDAWHADKLETLLAQLGGAQLVYSDARIVEPGGEVLSESYWEQRRNNHSSLSSLLMANSVTGAASLLRRELLDDALPFPPAQFAHFHDHWLGLVALALGDIAFVDRPLYDYVQHRGAVLGHAAANQMTGLGPRLARIGSDPRDRIRRWRMTYFVDNCRLSQMSTILRQRCQDRMAAPKRRTVERFRRAEGSPLELARLGLGAARELTGRPETLGAEVGLAFGLTWRRLLAASAGASERPRRRLRLDAVPPPSLAPKPGRLGPGNPTSRAIAEKVAPLQLAVSDDAPTRVNLLLPTIDLEHFFGGYIAKLNLARRLAERGLRVRLVTVDPVGSLPRSWRAQVESYAGLHGVFDRIEVAFGRESPGLEISRSDHFVATTWWSAHIAHAAVRSLDRERFLYLIQEYEPLTFPMGTYAALAAQSYRFPHRALFSTELLRDYFRRDGLGVYELGAAEGDAASLAFENAITPIAAPTVAELERRSSRRLLFYARPEPHAARNMFELGVLAIDRAVERGAFAGWDLHGIGTTNAARRIELGGGASLGLLPRSEQSAYGAVLSDHDVGLALMYTPHPSLVPIEMASAGMLTVTNSFENKTAEAMSALSTNLITAAPTVDGIAAALDEAAGGVADFERRARGSDVRWSRDWDSSFDDAVMERVEALLAD